MARHTFAHLSPEAARTRLEAADLEEKSRLAEGLALLALVDARRDYLELGYGCMRAYCMERLRWSEDRALKRLRVARLAALVPDVLDALADGRLTVTTARELASILRGDNCAALLAAASFQSQFDVRRIVREFAAKEHAARVDPQAARLADSPVEGVTAGGPGAAAPKDVAGGAGPEFAMSAPEPADSQAARPVNSPIRRGSVVRSESGEYLLRVTLTPEEHASLTAAQDLLAHVVRDGNPAPVLARALVHYVEHLRRRRFGAGGRTRATEPSRAALPRGRGIPVAIRREVAERDGYACAFVGRDGHRCAATRGLQYDHVPPLAEGGETSVPNLRLLGFSHAEAQEGPRIAEAAGGEPLEVRLKLALAALARPVLERGERRARATG